MGNLMFGADGILYLLGGAVITALISYMRGRVTGAKLERADQLAKEAKARDVADEIDDAVAGRSPGENRERLKQWRKS
jgi:uncharacterized membrane protein YdjX (TVP38/TMEM64 family)